MGRAWKTSINPSVKDVLSGNAARALSLAAEHVMGVSVEQTPIEEGNLRRSASTSVDEGNLKAVISYNSPYAVPVHEILTARHPRGNAKFLENAITSERGAVTEIIRKTLAGGF